MRRSELKSKANRTKLPKELPKEITKSNEILYSDQMKREKLSILKIQKHRKTLNHFGTSVNPIFLTNMAMETLKLS